MIPPQLAELADVIEKMIEEEVAARMVTLHQRIDSLEIELKRLAKEPRVIFSPTIQVPQQAAPIVNVENKVAAPIVNPTPVKVNVAAPEIKFEPIIEVPSPAPTPIQVNVTPELKLPPRTAPERKVTFGRNAKGEITGAHISYS